MEDQKPPENLLQKFVEELTNVSETTKNDYFVKLRSLQKKRPLDSDEDEWLDYCKGVENPNTRSNHANAFIRFRKHYDMPHSKLVDLKDYSKKDIAIHRKQKAKGNLDSMISYEDLLGELDKRHGANYFMNHMFCHHGLRVKDINCVYKRRLKKGEPLKENTLVFNPTSKKPKMTLHVVDYKTAKSYGPKSISMTDPRLYEELKGLNLQSNQYLFATKANNKPSNNYMNVRSCAESINKYGEGKIAKILIKNLLDTGQHDTLKELSKSRGTCLSTLYTHYNVYDH